MSVADKFLEQLRASHEAPRVAGTSEASAGNVVVESESLEQWQTSPEVPCVSVEFEENGQVKDLFMESQSESSLEFTGVHRENFCAVLAQRLSTSVSSRLASQDRAEVRVWESVNCVSCHPPGFPAHPRRT